MKKISIKKVDGGAIMNITEGSKTFTNVYVFSECVYSEKRDKFHTPAGNEIFDQMNNFEITDSWGDCLTCDIERCPNGYYATIKKDEEIIYEFVEELAPFPFAENKHFRDKLNCKLFEVISKLINEQFTTSLRGTNASVLEFEINEIY